MQRKCTMCGHTFDVIDHSSNKCEVCSKGEYRKPFEPPKKARKRYTLTCVVCGNWFTTDDYDQLCCSGECKEQVLWARCFNR